MRILRTNGHKMSRITAAIINIALWAARSEYRFIPVWNGPTLWGFKPARKDWYAFEVNGVSYPNGADYCKVKPPYCDEYCRYSYK